MPSIFFFTLDMFFHISPDSWQAIGVLTSQRWGLRWRTFEPAAPQGAVQGAVQTAVAKSGKGAVQGAVTRHEIAFLKSFYLGSMPM